MKSLILSLTLLICTSAFAEKVETRSCSDSHIPFNNVTDMKTYSNGSIKIFGMDHIEPAAVPFGLVVTLDRGEELYEMESFCRYISGLSWINVKDAKSVYDSSRNTLILTLDATSYDAGSGLFENKVLTVKVVRGAKKAEDTVLAEIN